MQEVAWKKKLKEDAIYVKNFNIWQEIVLILRNIRLIWKNRKEEKDGEAEKEGLKKEEIEYKDIIKKETKEIREEVILKVGFLVVIIHKNIAEVNQ